MRPTAHLLPLYLTIAISSPGQRIVKQDRGAADGYTFVAPINSSRSYLIDNGGKVVRHWDADGPPGLVAHFLPNGNILRTGTVASPVFGSSAGSGGRIDEIAPDGSRVWTYTLSTDKLFRHHDVAPMPNGNVLMIAWEAKTAAEAVAAGRDPSTISGDAFWSEAVFEVRPIRPTGGEIVWEWRVWDHLVQDFDPSRPNYGNPAAHPDRMDINYGPQTPDWLHFNAIAYNPVLDQIALSSRTLSEIWVIDRSTTSAEAATHHGGRQGKGGGILYRWGNPQVYRAGTAAHQRLFDQHNIQWIPPGLPGAGNLLAFSNGRQRNFSTVEEIAPPVDDTGAYRRRSGFAFGPEEPVWSYGADAMPRFVSRILGGVQRLPNGNTLICISTAHRILEVTPEADVVHELEIGEIAAGGSGTFRAVRVPVNFEGLRGTELYRPALDVANSASRTGGGHAPSSLATAATAPCDGANLDLTDAAGVVHRPSILSRSGGSLSFEVPPGSAIGPARLSARCGIEERAADIRIDRVAPALFSANGDGKGVGAIIIAHVRARGEAVYEAAFQFDAAGKAISAPVALAGDAETYLMLFGTGIRNAPSVSVEIGGREVHVSGFAAQSEFSGLDQVNIGPLPADFAGAGEQTIVLRSGDRSSNRVTVSFR